MANIPTVKLEGNKLVITIDASKEAFENAGPSSSGKTKLLASSHGFIMAAAGDKVVKISLNATI
jgi:hypothetical protein